MAEERIYTIPLRDAYKAPRTVRARKAMTYLKGYLKKHLKSDDVKIGPGLNHELWARGIQKPPRKIKVTVSKDDEIFRAELFGYKPKETNESKKKETKKSKIKEKLKIGKSVKKNKPAKEKVMESKKKEEELKEETTVEAKETEAEPKEEITKPEKKETKPKEEQK